MSVRARRRGREEAFKLLFEVDQGPTAWSEVLRLADEQNDLPTQAWTFARELADGAWTGRAEIDPMLGELAHGWTLQRMAAADRAILRLAAYELLHRLDTPVGVAINEAVELAKKYGTDDSPRFITGSLGTFVREHRQERLGAGDEV